MSKGDIFYPQYFIIEECQYYDSDKKVYQELGGRFYWWYLPNRGTVGTLLTNHGDLLNIYEWNDFKHIRSYEKTYKDLISYLDGLEEFRD